VISIFVQAKVLNYMNGSFFGGWRFEENKFDDGMGSEMEILSPCAGETNSVIRQMHARDLQAFMMCHGWMIFLIYTKSSNELHLVKPYLKIAISRSYM
jgi:hypothetical protein